MDALANYSRESDDEEDHMDNANGNRKHERKPGMALNCMISNANPIMIMIGGDRKHGRGRIRINRENRVFALCKSAQCESAQRASKDTMEFPINFHNCTMAQFFLFFTQLRSSVFCFSTQDQISSLGTLFFLRIQQVGLFSVFLSFQNLSLIFLRVLCLSYLT